MESAHILIMVMTMFSRPVVIQQEFENWRGCENAREQIVKYKVPSLHIELQGCHPKSVKAPK